VPDRLGVSRPGQRRQRLFQQPAQPPDIPGSVQAPFRLQLRRIAEPGDQVRIGVLIRLPRPVQVIQQAPGIPAAEHFPNHRIIPIPGYGNIPPHAFRRLIQPPDHPRTELCHRE
jgi:hypothetical protein